MAALVALPGLLVVRSPWRAVPALSVTFWVLTWTSLPHLPRTRVLEAVLLAFGTLLLLRVLRPGPLPRLRPRHLALLVAALAVGVALLRPPVPAGTSLPGEALAAELLVWRDGWPASFEPLVTARPFHASALATLAADVALLSRDEPHRATAVILSVPLASREVLPAASPALGPMVATVVLVALSALWRAGTRADLRRTVLTAALVAAVVALRLIRGEADGGRGPTADDVAAM